MRKIEKTIRSKMTKKPMIMGFFTAFAKLFEKYAK